MRKPRFKFQSLRLPLNYRGSGDKRFLLVLQLSTILVLKQLGFARTRRASERGGRESTGSKHPMMVRTPPRLGFASSMMSLKSDRGTISYCEEPSTFLEMPARRATRL